jgi:hypothetical protein
VNNGLETSHRQSDARGCPSLWDELEFQPGIRIAPMSVDRGRAAELGRGQGQVETVPEAQDSAWRPRVADGGVCAAFALPHEDAIPSIQA